MTLQITHIGLCVRDLERSRAFYRDALGMELVGELVSTEPETAQLLGVDRIELHIAYLERDGLRLELLAMPVPGVVDAGMPRPINRLGFTHLSVRVDDLDDVCRRIVECGGVVLDDTRVTFFGRTPAVMALDPDGVRLELLAAVERS